MSSFDKAAVEANSVNRFLMSHDLLALKQNFHVNKVNKKKLRKLYTRFLFNILYMYRLIFFPKF